MRFLIIIFLTLIPPVLAQNALVLQYPKFSGELFQEIVPVSEDSAVAIMSENRLGTTVDGGRHWLGLRIDTLQLQHIAFEPLGRSIYTESGASYRLKIHRLDGWGAQISLSFDLPTERYLGLLSTGDFGFPVPGKGYFATGGNAGFAEIANGRWRTYMPNQDHLQCIGSTCWMAVGGTTLYKSRDFGRSWRRLYRDISGVGVNMIDSLTGYFDNGRLYRTSDGGSTWTNIPTSVTGAKRFFTGLTGICEAPNWRYSLTKDGGTTWDPIASGTFTRAAFLNDTFGYLWNDAGLLVRTSNGSFSWDTLFRPAPSLMNCRGVHLSPDGTGVAAAGDFNPLNELLRTTDFGAEWKPVRMPDSNIPRLLDFPGEYFGYGVGVDTLEKKYTILVTTDGGREWKFQADLFAFGAWGTVEMPRYFRATNANTIAVLTDSSRILVSGDAGASWRAIPKTTISADAYAFRSTFFVNQSVGYVGEYPGRLWCTRDGGATWVLFEGPERDIFFLDANNGFGVRGNDLLRTTDGGKNWMTISQTDQSNSSLLRFRNSLLGLRISFNAEKNTTFANVTSDGGNTWRAAAYPGSGNIAYTACDQLNDTTFWVTGSGSHDRILRGTLGKTVAGAVVERALPTRPDISIFPNPARANQTMVIRVRSDSPCRFSRESLQLFDLLGRSITVQTTLETQDHELRFHFPVAALSPGIYLFTFRDRTSATMFAHSGKFIILP